MFIPEGLTEDEVIEIMNIASRKVAKKYRFGYLSNEDMEAHGVLEAIKVLNAGKFNPKPDGDLKKQLLGFLIIHIRNRCSNLRRKHSFRYASPDSINNQHKFLIMHPLQIHSHGLGDSNMFSREGDVEDAFDYGELIEKIRSNLSIPLLKDYLKLTNGVKISASRKKILLERLKEILYGDYANE